MAEWENYVKKTGVCCKCDKKLEEAEIYHASLNAIKDGFGRQDFCDECWSDELRDESFSFWTAKVPKKNEKKKLLVDDAVLIEFFKRLVESDSDEKSGFRFVLALSLMRKRKLAYVSTENSDSGEEIWIMKMVKETKPYRLPNPQLDDEQIENIRLELETVLAGD